MGKLIAKIVLTGGPCAGKTTTIARIDEHLTKEGYHVLNLNECATEVIKWGIRPFGDGKVSVYDFQNEILKLQLFKEKRFKEILDKLPSEKVILIADRGVIDNKAYLGQELFDKLLKENNLKEEDLLKEYDMVIHMITVANDMESRFSNSNNTARFENASEAVDLDKRTSDAWKNHPNVKTVPVCEFLEEKIEQAIYYVDELIESKENE